MTFTTAGTPNGITVVTQGIPGRDFALVTGGTCSTGTAYTVGQSCTVQYIFAPITPGLRNGGIVVKNSSSVILASSFLSGTGNGPQGLFQAGVSSFVYSTTLNQPRSLTVDPAGTSTWLTLRQIRC